MPPAAERPAKLRQMRYVCFQSPRRSQNCGPFCRRPRNDLRSSGKCGMSVFRLPGGFKNAALFVGGRRTTCEAPANVICLFSGSPAVSKLRPFLPPAEERLAKLRQMRYVCFQAPRRFKKCGPFCRRPRNDLRSSGKCDMSVFSLPGGFKNAALFAAGRGTACEAPANAVCLFSGSPAVQKNSGISFLRPILNHAAVPQSRHSKKVPARNRPDGSPLPHRRAGLSPLFYHVFTEFTIILGEVFPLDKECSGQPPPPCALSPNGE